MRTVLFKKLLVAIYKYYPKNYIVCIAKLNMMQSGQLIHLVIISPGFFTSTAN